MASTLTDSNYVGSYAAEYAPDREAKVARLINRPEYEAADGKDTSFFRLNKPSLHVLAALLDTIDRLEAPLTPLTCPECGAEAYASIEAEVRAFANGSYDPTAIIDGSDDFDHYRCSVCGREFLEAPRKAS